jgi:hypothetical protein
MHQARDSETLLTQRCGNVTIITLNRPCALNALSRDMIDGMWKVYTGLLAHPGTDQFHVAILKGSGGKVRYAILARDACWQHISNAIVSCAGNESRYQLGLTAKIDCAHRRRCVLAEMLKA